jgi:uncharacterized DUF497 family protein
VRVTWHAAKNLANQKKHGVSFEEVEELLISVEARLDVFDEDHSMVEERIISIGPIQRGLVVVVWTERDSDELRIISARMATRKERALYHAYFGILS